MAEHVKITEDGFKIGIGLMLAVAVSLAAGRIYVRAKLNRKIYVDDGFFSLAVVTLIGGTVMTYLDIPYIYLQQNVQAGSQAPPADFIQQLLKSVKIQNAAVVLLSATIFAIKLAFLAFFRGLIRRLKKLEIWWWCVLVVVVLSSIILICANFITCPYYDERILVISIPVTLLWRVRIDLRRKLALGTMLCLSVFTIITVIVKISGGNTDNGQIDSSWVIFWLHMEAAVAVMVASITAYRAIFVVERLRTQESPRYISRVRTMLWDRSKDSQEIPPLAQQSEARTACNPSNRGSIPFRNSKSYLRRPKSPCKRDSPSYQDGAVPRGLRSPLVSCGYPITGLPVALDDPGIPEPFDQQFEKHTSSSEGHLTTTSRSKELGVLQSKSNSAEHSRDLNQVTSVVY
ncbi:MAG: hypothetical protein Q9226_007213 [Calogaya cf. arnoldii]